MALTLNEVDKVEILTLQDNYIDVAAMDSSDMVQRAVPLKDMELKNSILAEHGFCAHVTVTAGNLSRSILFDFGFSEYGAALNAETLDLDLSTIEAMVLSHGHMDHFGGLLSLVERTGKKDLELVLHPSAFRRSRYIKVSDKRHIRLPSLDRGKIADANVMVTESVDPRPLLDGSLVFLGEIPKKTDFEKGFPRMYYEENGESKWDPIEEDTAIVAHVRQKGLVILSGCAHAGIVNTVKYAQEVTGIKRIYVIMGGFHLTGADFEPIIEPTIEALRSIDPEFIVPTHCTGRKATIHIEKAMPSKFLLNMSGTRMVFKA